MFAILNCVAESHDLRMALLAAAICAVACCVAFAAQARSLASRGVARWLAVVLAGLVAGSGVWATHFIGMLAYLPGTPMGFEPIGTAVSLIVAIGGMGIGFLIPVKAPGRSADAAGGLITGLSVAAMHFTGIAALRMPARLEWDLTTVAAALLVGVVSSIAAFLIRPRLMGHRAWAAPAAMLVFAIVGLHFTAMTAVRVVPDPTIALRPELFDRGALVAAAALLAGVVLAFALGLSWTERVGRRSTLTGLRAALDALPVGLAFFGPNDRLIGRNAAFAAIMSDLGIPPDQLVTRQSLLSGGLGGDRRHDQEAAEPGLPGEDPPTEPGCDFQLNDGRWMRRNMFRTDDGGGLIALSDISDHLARRKALADARDSAEAANAAKTGFLANISHEIRTPLNGMLGVAEVLAQSELTPKQRELVGVIRGSGGQLDGLLSDLLDLTRAEAGVLELRPEPTDIGALITAKRDLYAPMAEQKGLTLKVRMGPGAGDWVSCDSQRLRQVIGNLVSNAVKFTEVGQVTIAVDRTGDRLSFRVSDTGPGFNDAIKATLFSRFGQGDQSSTRRYGGAGLGLSISRDLVALMGGDLDCASRAGEGSIFMFTLNLPSVPAHCAETTEHRPTLGAFRVLIVDDNAINRQVLGLILDTVPIEHAEAADGQQGLDAAMTGGFDAVLMDLQMPVMDGFEATRRIRAWEAETGRARMPIIVVSANALPQHIDKSLQAGADEHLCKPVSVARLLAALDGQPLGEQAAA